MPRLFNSAGWKFRSAGGQFGSAGDPCCCGGSGGGSQGCSSCTDGTIGLSVTLSFTGLTYPTSCTLMPCEPYVSGNRWVKTNATLGSYCVNLRSGCAGFLTTPFVVHGYVNSASCDPAFEVPDGVTGNPPMVSIAQISVQKAGTVPGGAYWLVEVSVIANLEGFAADLFYGKYLIDDCSTSVVIPNLLGSLCASTGFSDSALAFGGSCALTVNRATC